MNSTQTMMDVPSAFRSLHWPVAAVLALLLAGLWLAGYGPGGAACAPAPARAAAPIDRVPAQAAVQAPTQAPTLAPAPLPSPAASGVVVAVPAIAAVAPATAGSPAAAKIYFASGRAEINAAGLAKTVPFVDYLKANAEAKVQISGFHDPRGNKVANEELALNRARAVRALLQAKGIATERVVMAKPVETSADGSREEARRVELSVLP